MRMRTILISLVVLCILLVGCKTYKYPTNETAEQGSDDFKSEFEKLQALLEEEEEAPAEEELVEIAEEEPEEQEKETELVEEEPEVVEEEPVVVKEEPKVTVQEGVTTIKVKEGDLVNLAIKAEDPEGDTITYTFTEPLDSSGKWQTGYDDAGTYKVTITASDGQLSTSQDVNIMVEEYSRKPVISNFDDLTVYEGDKITLSPKVTDPEGGTITVEYSGWMTSSTKTTGYDDAGSHQVTLKATSSESDESVSKTITITVKDKNRPPVIISVTNK